ncbi:MAG: hypothetical protein WD273_09980 [Trueperaceae bacterium]
MKTSRIVALLGLALLLSACTLTVRPGANIDVQAVSVVGAPLVNGRLGLHGYPHAVIVSLQERRGSSQTTFETGASLDAVYSHFHRQLAGQGWRRNDYEGRPHKVEAEYRRGEAEVDFELDRQGRSGRYRLDIDFDDD